MSSFLLKERIKARKSSNTSSPTMNTTKKDTSTYKTEKTETTTEGFHLHTESMETVKSSNLEDIVKTFYSKVYAKMKDDKTALTNEYKNRCRTLSCLESDFARTKKTLGDTEQNNNEIFQHNNILQFECKRLIVEKTHNKNEIEHTKSLIEKMKKHIDTFEKSNRLLSYELIDCKEDLQLKSSQCKELSQKIAVGIEDKKTLISALLSQQNKIYKLKYILSKHIEKDENVGNDINTLIKIYG